MWRVIRHALGNGGFCNPSWTAAASPSPCSSPASVLLRTGGRDGYGAAATATTAFFATGTTTTAAAGAVSCSGCESSSSSPSLPPSPSSGNGAVGGKDRGEQMDEREVAKEAKGKEERTTRRPTDRHPPPTFRRRKLSVVLPPPREDVGSADVAVTEAADDGGGGRGDDDAPPAKDDAAPRAPEEGGDDDDEEKKEAGGTTTTTTAPPTKRKRRRRDERRRKGGGGAAAASSRMRSSEATECVDVPAAAAPAAPTSSSSDDAAGLAGLGMMRFFSSHHASGPPSDASSSSPGDDDLPFPPSRCAVLSAHGVEPHPYLLRPPAPLLFGRSPPPRLVTVVTRKINQDRGRVCHPYGHARAGGDDEAELATTPAEGDDCHHGHEQIEEEAEDQLLAERTALFAAYDGHGERGEMVAEFVMEEVPRRLRRHPEFRRRRRDGEVDGNGRIEIAFRDTFREIDNAVMDRWEMKPHHSGSTACVVLLRGSDLYAANIGDSRAVLGRRRWQGRRRRRRRDRTTMGEKEADSSSSSSLDEIGERYVPLDLTTDQSPSHPTEMSRIHSRGGYVSPPGGPGEPARVWADHHHSMVGLAMSRSFGDFNVKDLGVICDPVVTAYGVVTAGDLEREEEEKEKERRRRRLRRQGDGEDDGGGGADDAVAAEEKEEEAEEAEEEAWADEFLIVATDGVWEFLSSARAVDIVGRVMLDEGRGASEACAELIRTAVGLWKEHEGDYRDDVTAVVVRLDGLWEGDDDEEEDEDEEGVGGAAADAEGGRNS